jgi:methionyl-tRNA formyltransferase
MRVAFMGTPDFAAASLAAVLDSAHEVVCVVSQPDRRAGRGNKLTSPPVALLAKARDLPLAQPEGVGTLDFRTWLASHQPDIAVVAAFGQILGPKLLALPPRGCINVHASLLPRWRGASPIQAAILAGDAQSGVSIMEMERGLDTGPVLGTVALELAADETGTTLHDRLAAAGATLLLEVLGALETAPGEAAPQEEALATYAPQLRRSDGDLDFGQPAAALERRIRALHPWPGTRAQLAGRDEPIKLHPPSRVVGCAHDADPGTIVAATARGIEVVAGDGNLLCLERLQAPGRKALDAGAFLAGYPILAGERLT